MYLFYVWMFIKYLFNPVFLSIKKLISMNYGYYYLFFLKNIMGIFEKKLHTLRFEIKLIFMDNFFFNWNFYVRRSIVVALLRERTRN